MAFCSICFTAIEWCCCGSNNDNTTNATNANIHRATTKVLQLEFSGALDYTPPYKAANAAAASCLSCGDGTDLTPLDSLAELLRASHLSTLARAWVA